MKKYSVMAAILIALALLLNACGGPGKSAARYDSGYAVQETMAATTAAAAAYAKEQPAMMGYAMNDAAAPMAMPEAYEEYEGGYDSGSGASASSGTAAEVPSPKRKLIKNVYMDIETKEIDNLVSTITARISALGGYVENSSISRPTGSNSRRSAYINARIPADKLNDFVYNVEEAGNVTFKSEDVTDVTLTYTDIESHKHSLEVERDRLLELLEKAEDLESILAIEERLSEIRYKLESFESQLRVYDNQVDYSTVNINISEVVDYTPPAKRTIGERISDGFADTVDDVKTFFEDLFVDIIVYSPVLAILAVVIIAGVLIVRRCSKKAKARRAAKKAAKAAEAAQAQANAAGAAGNAQAETPAGTPEKKE